MWKRSRYFTESKWIKIWNIWTTPYTGKFKENYATGQLKSEGKYKNGEKEGLLKGYRDTGKLKKEENYKAGKEEGLVKTYYDTGKLEEKEIYKNGKLLKIQ